jgi:hypothetical protein
MTRMTRRLAKNCQIFERIAQKVANSKQGQTIYNKAQFESPKHLHQTTFETLKYLHQACFETTYLGKNVINLLKQKVAKKSPLFSATSSFQKIIMSLCSPIGEKLPNLVTLLNTEPNRM